VTLSNQTVTFAAQFDAAYPGAESTVRRNGGLVHGVAFDCYLHGVDGPTDAEHYFLPNRAPTGCTIVLNDTLACHVDMDGEVWHTEDAEWFRYRAQRWLQPWRTLFQLCEDAERELKRPWTWATIARPGAVTLLVGPPKLGKSTLVFDFLNAMIVRRECIGLATELTNVLYVSEEGEVPLAYKGNSERLRGVKRAQYVSFLTSYEAGGDWLGLMKLVDRAVREMADSPGFLPPPAPLLVVIDTLGFFLGLDDENQAGGVRNALRLIVNRVREHNFACLLLHHARKATVKDAAWVSQVQGSTAFAGNVDIVVALTGDYRSEQRTLHRIGRFGTYDALDLTYSEEVGYRLVTETERQAQHRERLEKVRVVLEDNPGASLRAIAEATEIPVKSVQRLKRELEEV